MRPLGRPQPLAAVDDEVDLPAGIHLDDREHVLGHVQIELRQPVQGAADAGQRRRADGLGREIALVLHVPIHPPGGNGGDRLLPEHRGEGSKNRPAWRAPAPRPVC